LENFGWFGTGAGAACGCSLAGGVVVDWHPQVEVTGGLVVAGATLFCSLIILILISSC